MDKFDALSEMPCSENKSRRRIKKVLYLVKSLLRKREIHPKARFTPILEFRTEYRPYKVKVSLPVKHKTHWCKLFATLSEQETSILGTTV